MIRLLQGVGTGIKAEWERVLFWGCLTGATWAFAFCLLGRHDTARSGQGGRAARLYRSPLNESALRFLDPPPPDAGGQGSPFAFRFSLPRPATGTEPTPLPPGGPASAVAATNGSVDAGADGSPPGSDAAIDSASASGGPSADGLQDPVSAATVLSESGGAEAAAAALTSTVTHLAGAEPLPADVPAPRRPVRFVGFRGVMKTATGKLVALISARDPAMARETLAYLQPGATTADGIRVTEVSHSSLCVVAPSGKVRTIGFGDTAPIAID